MPPTQSTTHHSPWLWNVDDQPLLRQNSEEKTEAPPLFVAQNVKADTPTPCLTNAEAPVPLDCSDNDQLPKKTADSILCSKSKTCKLPKKNDVQKMHQGKITEYFKTHVKPINGFKKTLSVNKRNKLLLPQIDQQTQFDSLKVQNPRRNTKVNLTPKKSTKPKRFATVTVPRKILPAPAKSETITIRNNVNNIINFPLALSTVNFTPNLTYLHTKVPKPPDNMFAPQFASITDKINAIPNAIPIINRTPCLNVIQPIHPKIATINNFNCVKLNATMVPIVKLNSMPSKMTNGPNRGEIVGGQPGDLGLMEAAVPTVITPKISECRPAISVCQTGANQCLPNVALSNVDLRQVIVNECTSEVVDCQMDVSECQADDLSRPVEVKIDACPGNYRSDNSVCQDNVSGECFYQTNDSQESVNGNQTVNSDSISCETPKCARTSSPTTCTSSSSSSSSDDACNDSGISSEVCSDGAGVESTAGVPINYNLEISVNVPAVTESLKSPILSKPKTIRFPFQQQDVERRKSQKSLPSVGDSGRCRWADCNAQFDTSGALLEHLQHKHVISQATRDEYTCFWSGCKVHGRTSCSRSWLERHVLAHAGTKLFRCIVDGCRQRFNSQLTLQRHVNGHFNSDGKPNDAAKKSPETISTKLFKRNGKKIRFRRQPWSARMFDFIDSGIMEGIQYKLMDITQKRTLGDISASGEEISLQSQVLARRIESDGTTKILVRWHPQDVVSDEWVNEKDFEKTKVVHIPTLNAAAKDALKPMMCQTPERSRKHRRKPMKEQT
ncbi:hypothetical protein WA026_019212 [Henosepilachna vigintioctopunctata]|uniref:C2H2-type domain-containing protein n=1 Tax=Henosepilachna vigintioctopunctata TaxID=420089 RepID=A0AAW1V440_9CUCU